MRLIPQPQYCTLQEDTFHTDYNTIIVMDQTCGETVFLYAEMLRETMQKWCGIENEIRRGEARKGDIQFSIAQALAPQQYTLHIKTDGIFITGGSEEALLHGIQTLRQIYSQSGPVLPALEINDYPSIPNRGFFHDVSRGRVPHLNELKKLADKMSYYKLNQLQLYIEHTYLFRDFSEVHRDETPLTAKDILELGRYCRERHIDLVPSLASFGHLYMMLRTYTFAELCETFEPPYQPFSFEHRMFRHTINVSHKDALPILKSRVIEYMHLFQSRYFNLCADETFDLCKGKSRDLLKEQSSQDVYCGFLKELCACVVENGKIPMFWGDIIGGSPERLAEFPKESICLNWGYSPDQTEDGTRILAENHVKQYVCPGTGGWNQWINVYRNAYQNISRMCGYAGLYHADGVLNTDWGGDGHINQPELSIPSMIFGAAFSWNTNITGFDETAELISFLEFHDRTGRFLSLVSAAEGTETFPWHQVVQYYELYQAGGSAEELKQKFFGTPVVPCDEADTKLLEIRRELLLLASSMDSSTRYLLQKYLLGIDSIRIWNRVKPALAEKIYQSGKAFQKYAETAAELENWFMRYKTEWRKSSREGDLNHISAVIFWYADQLRK